MALTAAQRPTGSGWYQLGRAASISHGPVLGAISDRGVKIWARADGDGRFQVQLKPSSQAWPGWTLGDTPLTSSHDFTGVVEVSGLAPATSYDYRLLLNGLPTDNGETFKTLPPAGIPGAFRFSIGGDLSSAFAPFAILDRLREQGPNFNIFLGDLIYADQPTIIPPTMDAYQAKYRDNWGEPSFRQLTRNVPSFMIWDDHEIVNDYDGGKAGRYLPARAALADYVGAADPAPRRPGELYFSFQVADVDFFVLDTRSYRSPETTPDGPAKTMLGADQKDELASWLQNSRAPFKILVSSVPFHDFGGYRADAWSGYATERAQIFDFIRQRGITGVVLLSGDQHWSSLVRHDPSGIWEFNATPLAHRVTDHPRVSDPRLVLTYDGGPAFGIVDVDTRGPSPRLSYTIADAAGQSRGSVTITP